MSKNRNKKELNYISIKDIDKKVFFRVLKYYLNYKVILFFAIISMFLNTFANVKLALFIGTLIDDYIKPMLLQDVPNFNPLLDAIKGFVLILIVGIISSFTNRYSMVIISQSIMKKIREDMFSKMQKLPISFFDKNNTGDIMSRYTNDLNTLREVLSQTIPQLITSIITFITIFVSMICISFNLTLVVIAMCLFIYLFTKFISKISISSYKLSRKAIGDLNGYVEEMVNGAKDVKVFCYEERNCENFVKKNNYWRKNIVKADFISISLMPIMGGCGNTLYVLLAFFGAVIYLNNIPNIAITGIGNITLGIITSFLLFSKNFTMQISIISNQFPYILQSLTGADRIFNIIDTKEEVDDGFYVLKNNNIKDTTNSFNYVWENTKNNEIVPLKGHIVLENVNFSYDKDNLILKNISVYANPGEKVALVGCTGAGKTTITNLINRFYDIDSGSITIDGISVLDIEKKSLRDSLSVVLQDVSLFTGTILDNIRYGKLDATDEECINAAKLVKANEFIEKLPDKYNTMIGGDGGGLSQGQKQLISVARAAVADPKILILDEATSSIDTKTERIVQEGMDRIMKGRTVFVIAHRLSTIKNSDVIMVMDNGEIIERGTHDMLYEKKGKYYQLYTGTVDLD